MGGIGSGRRWHHGARGTTENSLNIDVRRWRKDGWLTPGKQFAAEWSRNGKELGSVEVESYSGCVELSYRYRSGGGAWKDLHYRVVLEWTPCHFGGERPWFRCPASGCGRRVALLYCAGLFACRRCCDLAYASQNDSGTDRAVRRSNTIRKKLGWKPGFFSPQGSKPKGMHWRTYRSLKAEHQARERRASRKMMQALV